MYYDLRTYLSQSLTILQGYKIGFVTQDFKLFYMSLITNESFFCGYCCFFQMCCTNVTLSPRLTPPRESRASKRHTMKVISYLGFIYGYWVRLIRWRIISGAPQVCQQIIDPIVKINRQCDINTTSLLIRYRQMCCINVTTCNKTCVY